MAKLIKTSIGESLHLTDSAEGKAVEFALYGKAKQNTTTGKNLLPYPYSEKTHTDNGITFTDNGDGSVTVNGTATSTSYFNCTGVNEVDFGNVNFNSNSNQSGEYICTLKNGIKDGLFLSYNSVNKITSIDVRKGTKVDNVTVYPMVRLASITDDTYEPYTNGASPNPQYPQPIEVSGESGSVTVKSCGKNLLIDTRTDKSDSTMNGVTFKTNDDGTYHASGKRTETGTNTRLILTPTNRLYLPKGTYTANSGLIEDVGSLQISIVSKNTHIYAYNTPKTFTLDKEEECWLCLNINKNYTNDVNATFYPQIEKGSVLTPFEKPKEPTIATIPTPNGLAGIKVSSNGNYTDSNGQQWICDEIVKYADGSGEYIERIKHYSLAIADMNNNEDYPGWVGISDLPKVLGETIGKVTTPYMLSIGSALNVNTKSNNVLYLSKDIYGYTQSEWKTNYPDLVVDIYLAKVTPIHTPLTAEEIAEIEKLQTFYPVTNISNDFDCGMSVTYSSNVIEWENPNTYWKKTDRFNISDFNRIKNNLMYLHNVALVRVGAFEIESMGEEYIVGVDEYKNWLVEDFNAIENNLHTISKKIIDKDIGAKKTFYENGLMPDFAELNRIETVILNDKNALDNLSAGIRRIPFRLGQYKTRF